MAETRNRFFPAGLIALIILPCGLLLLHTFAMNRSASALGERLLMRNCETVARSIESEGRRILGQITVATKLLERPDGLLRFTEMVGFGPHVTGFRILDANDGVLLEHVVDPVVRLQAAAEKTLRGKNEKGHLSFVSGATGTPYIAVTVPLVTKGSVTVYLRDTVLDSIVGAADLRASGISVFIVRENRQIFCNSVSGRLNGLPFSIVSRSDGNADILTSLGAGSIAVGFASGSVSTNALEKDAFTANMAWRVVAVPGERIQAVLLAPVGAIRKTGEIEPAETIILHITVLLCSLLAILLYVRAWRVARQAEKHAALVPDLKQNMSRLEEASLRYSMLFNSMVDGILLLDVHGRIIDCNRTFAEMLGYEPRELIGMNQRILTPPRFWQFENEGLFNQLSSWGSTKDYEKEFIRQDGSMVPVMMNACMLQDAGGKGSSILATLRDISEQKRAIGEVNRLGLLLEDIIESSPLSIITLDEKLRIRTINSSAERFFRISRGLAINASIFIAIPFFERFRGLFERTISENRVIVQNDETLVFGDNDEKHTNITIYPLHSRETGSVAIHVEDITDQVHLERRLFQSQKMEALGTLASGFAHDFNNLLSGIFSYLTVIRMKTDDTEITEPLELVFNIARRASTLVKHIVTFSRSSSIRTTPVNVATIVNEVMTMVGESFPKNIEIRNLITDQDCHVNGDQSQLAQVLLNLCINARDAMPDGGTLSLSLERQRISEEDARHFRMLQPGNVAKITVSDSGQGIDPAIADKVFDPFFTTKSDRNGTGMGLFIVYGVLRSHHGDIELDSVPGQGTQVSIYLPLSDVSGTNGEEGGSEVSTSRTMVHRGKVLIIDDEEVIGNALRDGFSRLGFEVRTAISGEAGLEACRENLPELVVLDMIMPGLSGEETYDRLKSEFPGLKVVIHTGYTHVEVEKRMLEKGVLDVLHKPYEIYEVADRIARWIQG